MPSAWIETPGAIIRLHSERLEVTLPAEDGPEAPPPVDMPLAELERLTVSEQARLTFPALCEALRRQIPVVVQDWRGAILGSFLPAATPHAALRLRQYQRVLDPAFSAHISRLLIQAKIRNQRRLLGRLCATRHRDIGPALDAMAAALADTDRARDVDTLRGHEGIATARYWPAWAAFLPPEFPFTCRATRPPPDAVNAVISYLASALYGEVLAACHRRGLDPGLGHLHPATDRRWSLPLDLMEPFRPCVSEAAALRLFTHRMLSPADFQPRDGGVFLTVTGRRTAAAQFDARLRREFHSEHAGCRTTLRRQIEDTALSYRMALENGSETFRPYIMN